MNVDPPKGSGRDMYKGSGKGMGSTCEYWSPIGNGRDRGNGSGM